MSVVTRLDRLYVLLEKGSNSTIRLTAARQIAECVINNTQELPLLLSRTKQYLFHENWDTRIAASEVIKHLALNSVNSEWESDEIDDVLKVTERLLTLKNLNISDILKKASNLLSSKESKYNNDGKVSLSEQKSRITASLTNPIDNSATDFLKDMFTPTDFITDEQSSSYSNNTKDINEYFKKEDFSPPTKKLCSGIAFDKINVTTTSIFTEFCQNLCEGLFFSNWTCRHGASSGILAVLKVYCQQLGTNKEMTKEQATIANKSFLEDLSSRLICVLALDRFGDYVCDEVVAPVRQTCAMTLGRCSKHLDTSQMCAIWSIFKRLLDANLPWEVRHGATLAVQYMLLARDEMNDILPVLPKIVNGLSDCDDDVKSVSASTLLHALPYIVEYCKGIVTEIIALLWQSLIQLDDLTSSTINIMSLLSSIIDHNVSYISMPTEYIPRLFPFLSHTNASVRLKTLMTLEALLKHPPDLTETRNWINVNLSQLLRHLFQRGLVENRPEVQEAIVSVWRNLVTSGHAADILIGTVSPLVGVWFSMTSQHHTHPLDSAHIIVANYSEKSEKVPIYYLGSIIADGIANSQIETYVMRSRLLAARLLSFICEICSSSSTIPQTFEMLQESPYSAFCKLLSNYFNSNGYMNRLVVSAILFYCPKFMDRNVAKTDPNMAALFAELESSLTTTIYHSEIVSDFTSLQQLCKGFINMMGVEESYKDIFPIKLDIALHLANHVTAKEEPVADTAAAMKTLKALNETREQRRKAILEMCSDIKHKQNQQRNRICCLVSGILIRCTSVGHGFTPYVRPVINLLRSEPNPQLQLMGSQVVISIIDRLNEMDKECVTIRKMMGNLCDVKNEDCHSICRVGEEEKACLGLFDQSDLPTYTGLDGIVTLSLMQHPTLSKGLKYTKYRGACSDNTVFSTKEKVLTYKLRGISISLQSIFQHYKENVYSTLPILHALLLDPLLQFNPECMDPSQIQILLNSLQVLEMAIPFHHEYFNAKLFDLLSPLFQLLGHPFTYVRYKSSCCIAVISTVIPLKTLTAFIECQIEVLNCTSASLSSRMGTVETIAQILQVLPSCKLLPFSVIINTELLCLVSCQEYHLRLLANWCFSNLIRICSIESSIADPPGMNREISLKRLSRRNFFNQLLNGSQAMEYDINFEVNVTLRNYQKEGINWLAFLCQYGLHGILCDDMGLGKTLQTLMLLANEHQKDPNLLSIVICPSTLAIHWLEETKRFISSDILRPIMYMGTPQERLKMRFVLKKYNFIITSYESIRSDIDYLRVWKFSFCILDEGHIIKNSKTKLSKAVKQVCARHRIILTGTPIQNNVVELWSLFDFLMPGYLGSEKQFWNIYAKPILSSRDSKCSPADIEQGNKAIERLHKQALPFILRRLKSDVLQDLPAKIVQDYFCELSPLQRLLYANFADQNDTHALTSDLEHSNNKSHVFKNLHYLRKLCNHPKLVDTSHLLPSDIEELKIKNPNLSYDYSPKIVALKQILSECGIGVEIDNSTNQELSDSSIINNHRVLIFCQQRKMLDIIEKEFKRCPANMRPITHLRLDGGTPISTRGEIVSRFNGDPSIDVLLLTTRVGGLGLTLTGADTVVFVDHDWNPSKDLQAMDRAHRIGQKRVVNVYRLITRNTLEEKIMCLQKFKQNLSDSVITEDNRALSTMKTDQVVDLFSYESESDANAKNTSRRGSAVGGGGADGGAGGAGGGPGGVGKSATAIIESLNEIYDFSEEYREEYDTQKFVNDL